jgi:hypothetical protein
MLCPKCNQPVADGARFCAGCGQPLSPASNPDATLLRPPRGPVGGTAASSALPPGGAAPPGGGAAPGGFSTAGPGPAGTLWSGLIDRVKNILLTPKTEWPVIEAEPTSVAQLYKGYAIPLAAFSALISFVRMSVIGYGFFRLPLLSGLVYAVVSFGFALLGLFLVGLIIDGLAPTFAGQRDQRQAIKTAAYAFTPAAVGAVFGILPALGWLLQLLAGLYGIYLLYLGLPRLMRSPQDKAVGYTAAVVICTIVLAVVLGILMSVTGRITGYSPYGTSYGYGGLTREERQQQAAAAIGSALGGALARGGLTQGGSSQGGVSQGGVSQDGLTPEQRQQQAAAAVGSVLGGNRHVDPVDFHALKSLLPDSLPGMQRTNAEGASEGVMGMQASSATGSYQGQGNTRAEIKIVDASAVSALLNLADAVAANASSESDTGFEKNATVGGRTVHEKYDNQSKHGEVTAIVARRFTVDVSADGVDMGTLEQYAALVDYSKLEAMRDAGAHP